MGATASHDEATPSMPPPAVQVSMSLDMDFSQAGEEGSEERAQFKRDVAADVSSALASCSLVAPASAAPALPLCALCGWRMEVG